MIVGACSRLGPTLGGSLRLPSLLASGGGPHPNSLLLVTRRRFGLSSHSLLSSGGNEAVSPSSKPSTTPSGAATQPHKQAGLKAGKGGHDGTVVAEPERTYLEEMLIQREEEPKTTGQKVKRAVETTFYISFGLISCAVLGVMTYLVFREFFAFNTPQGVYRDAVKRVKSDMRCADMFGKRIMTFGEESGRGRRRHIMHNKYVKDGEERLSIMFHVKGDAGIGRVYAEICKAEDGTWAYRFILVETDGFPKKTMLLLDNRKKGD